MQRPTRAKTTVATQTDTRRHPRHALNKRVSVRLPDWSRFSVWGHDISRGGIKLSLPDRITPGDRLDIALTLPNDLRLDLKAEVRFAIDSRPGECQAGLQWLEPNSSDMEFLHALLDDLSHGGADTARPPVATVEPV